MHPCNRAASAFESRGRLVVARRHLRMQLAASLPELVVRSRCIGTQGWGTKCTGLWKHAASPRTATLEGVA